MKSLRLLDRLLLHLVSLLFRRRSRAFIPVALLVIAALLCSSIGCIQPGGVLIVNGVNYRTLQGVSTNMTYTSEGGGKADVTGKLK